MKKVLIISYFAPPCNLTGANRVGLWMKYFPENEVYPILITRNWDGTELTEGSRLMDSGESITHVNQGDVEIYFMPYASSLRDKAFVRGNNSIFFRYLSKILTFINLFAQNIWLKFIPYNNIYYHARKVLKNDKEIRSLLISGNPFEQFFFGYLLKKEFKDLLWIADYRDDWTTNPLYAENLSSKVFKAYNQCFEKKWVGRADHITTVTPLYKERLERLHKKPCTVIRNGFNEDVLRISKEQNSSIFQITYSGSVYPKQDFTSIIEVLNQIAINHPTKQIVLTFLGSKGFLNSKQRSVLEQETPVNFKIEVTERIPWVKSISFAKSSDVLFLGAYGNLKGVIPSKVFEYVVMGVPVVCFPTDGDIIEKIILDTQAGAVCSTTTECYQAFDEIIDDRYELKLKKDEANKYSAKFQINKLASLLAN